MLTVAIVLIVIAAFLGVALAAYVFLGKVTPKGLAFIHGPIAALGVIVLIVLAVRDRPALWLPIGVFAVAAFLGLWLITSDLRGTGPSKVGAALHGVVAVAGFAVLLYLVLRGL